MAKIYSSDQLVEIEKYIIENRSNHLLVEDIKEDIIATIISMEKAKEDMEKEISFMNNSRSAHLSYIKNSFLGYGSD